jgi:hypothetical protein
MRARLFKRFDRRNVEREVESELHFHLELLIEENLRQGMTLEEAEGAASKRFGNIERIKNQCVEISKRSRPLMRVLKSFLVVVFLTGVLVRFSSADIYVAQTGNMLMIIPALGSLLLYLRDLRFSSFASKDEDLSPLGLSAIGQAPLAANDRKEFTPLERVISDD